MLRSIVCALALLIAVPFAAIARPAPHADLWNGKDIAWRDVRSGISESAQTGRPAIMVFHTTWCSVCKRFRLLFKNPEIVAASKDFVMILVDADVDREVNGIFSKDGNYVPRTIFMDANGKVSNTLVGRDRQYPHTLDVDRPDELLALMKRARGLGGTAPKAPPSTESRT
ncbi:hypothetical protein DLM45_05985 [Hyphomicrobium methylovorum]|uniref:thioredoxin family protein n=1 Tax=Hyphomicrobium methylovorum TaxID=84 RepID=UPI0015E7D8AA|nr:thioredoxin family protein [Hyphomicrobium methylovorum]MBA2125774.1 hypothetical protein [Hyphomicrobium methylovorum]